jgi:4'-phosphopantetheinyl transferase
MGISYIKRVSEDGLLGLWHMTESWNYLHNQLDLHPDDEAMLRLKKTDKRRQEWLTSRLLLKHMLDLPHRISYDENGKPCLTDRSHHISISHSGTYTCIYLHTQHSVGIDVQILKPSIAKGADFFLSDEEQQWADPTNNLLLHIIWSVKETIFKYAGNPELDPKKHIITRPFAGNQNEHIEVKLLNKGKIETITTEVETFDNYVLTWTV